MGKKERGCLPSGAQVVELAARPWLSHKILHRRAWARRGSYSQGPQGDTAATSIAHCGDVPDAEPRLATWEFTCKPFHPCPYHFHPSTISKVCVLPAAVFAVRAFSPSTFMALTTRIDAFYFAAGGRIQGCFLHHFSAQVYVCADQDAGMEWI